MPPIKMDENYFRSLPKPSDAPKEEQREVFIECHGGQKAEEDFETWWRVHKGDEPDESDS